MTQPHSLIRPLGGLLLLSALCAPLRAEVVAGDIAIVGMNFDGTDAFAFVALQPIAEGDSISFTDNGWLASGSFRSGEGTVTWTAPSGGVAVGTVVTLQVASPISASVGEISGSSPPNFSASGDQVLAYTGSSEAPVFVYAVNNDGAGVWQADATSTNNSALPTGLVEGSTAVALPELDNYTYTGTTTGLASELLAAIGNAANWTGSDTVEQTFPTSFTVTQPPSLSIADVAQAEGDADTSLMTFEVTLDKAASGAFSVQYATGDQSATAGSDYVATSGTLNFAGTAGEVQSFTVTINGDTASEGDETFIITLSNLSGTTDAVIGDATATGTISNDDVVPPNLSVVDVTVDEGDSGTRALTFVLQLDAPAPSGAAVQFVTVDGTASAGEDYQAASGTASFEPGASSAEVVITVNGDTAVEADETFTLQLSSPTNLALVSTSAVGTLRNDDFDAISSIQGSGAVSPRVGESVLVRGIVTTRINNGFYMQSQLSDEDGDPQTSEGLFVFTGSADVVPGNLVQVAGTVSEFVPSSDPNQQGQTQLSSPVVSLISAAAGFPVAVELSTTLPSPNGGIDQLEHLENMRVTAPSFTVVGPTDGNTSETNASSSSNGRFYAVIGDNARPFREPGLEPEDAAGQPLTVPVWDGNPEKINIESSRARNAANVSAPPLDVDVGATVTGLFGVLDYSFRNYRITVDFDDVAPVATGGRAPAAVSAATAEEYTIGTYNLERFFNDINDPGIGEPVLTAQAFANRLNKASLGIRQFMGTPDIIGIVEIENLDTLQALADKVNADALAATGSDPQYQAFLEEGTDIGGIDVGFLVKTAPVTGTAPRVRVDAVTQFGKDTLLKCPDGQDNTGDSFLNDRPPLLLEALVTAPNGASQAVTVVVNHFRSLGDVNSGDADTTACPGVGFPSKGERVRSKRQQQAEFLANLVQARQLADAEENIVLVGDFNAFEFNDGFGDLLGTLTGQPAANDATLVEGDGADLVEPNLINLNTTVDQSERYSFVFAGNAQNLDHVLVNAAINASASPRLEHARINADFAEDNRGDADIAVRLADHDPAVAFFRGPGFALPEQIFRNGFEEPL